MIGASTADQLVRVPTISFVVKNRKSSEIPLQVDPHQMGIRWGDFYAKRLIEALRLDKNDGVVRVSLVHYNTLEEVHRLIEVMDSLI
jgi:selenocysteine lyase/cysteine desulfurase